MARPTKQGVDYFPLDLHLDDKFKFIEIKYGLEGFAVVIKLLQKIYSYGFWYSWTEDEMLLFSDEIRADFNLVKNVFDECIYRGIFDEKLYEKYGILTSRGIQKRYFDITKRRKDVDAIKQYLLIEVVNDNINLINVCNNEENACKSTQSKVKESKVKESKVSNAHTREGDIFKDRSFSPKMQDKLTEWLTYKKERRESYKPTGLKSFLSEVENKLKLHSESDIIALIGECMANNWRGIIWDKIKNRASPKNHFDRPTENYDHLVFNPFEEEAGIGG